MTGNLSDPAVNKRNLCNVACNYPNTTGVCTSSFDIPEFINDFNTGVVMKPGSTCNGVEGYCDVFSRCRSANTNAQLNRLVSLLLTNITVEDIKQWVKTYWWAVLIFCIIFVVLFNLLIWGLSKLMPSSNPNKPKKHVRRVLLFRSMRLLKFFIIFLCWYLRTRHFQGIQRVSSEVIPLHLHLESQVIAVTSPSSRLRSQTIWTRRPISTMRPERSERTKVKTGTFYSKQEVPQS